MTPVNRDLVRTRAAEIRAAVAQIRSLVGQSDEALYGDARNLYSIQFLLLVAIEAAAGLCNHILARHSRIAPTSYPECVQGLYEAGIVDEGLAGRLTRMLRFRNLLVGRYWDVDDRRVVAYAREDLGDLESYLEAIDRWLSQQPS